MMESSEAQWLGVCLAGGKRSASDAIRLETLLLSDPADLHARVELIGFYTLQHGRLVAAWPHIKWLIENRPEIEIGSFAAISGVFPDAYREGKALWLAALDAQRRNPDPRRGAIVRNAKDFLILRDPEHVARLLVEMTELEPATAEWPIELARFNRIKASRAAEPRRTELLLGAIAAVEHALTLEMEPGKRYLAFVYAAQASHDVGKHVEAIDFSARLLSEIGTSTQWAAVYGTHQAHIVMGLSAVALGDLTSGMSHLAASVETAIFDDNHRFEPNFALAALLLSHGAMAPVLRFLERCGRLWPARSVVLGEWSDLVKRGETPSFELRNR